MPTTLTADIFGALLQEGIWPITKFQSDFECGEQIGEGKFGKVVKVRCKKTNKVFAAKHMACKKAAEKLRVRDEIDILKRIDHPRLLKLVAAYENMDEFVQVLEYLDGGELFNRIVESDVDLVDISGLVKQILEGCDYLHERNIVHLDLKPENIVCVSPTSFDLKIVDFGFARTLSGTVRVMQGTPEFVSPEVIAFEPISTATDMWSVGVIAYVLLSGLSPFLGETNQDTYNNILIGHYSFDEPDFDPVGEDAKDFIKRLLVHDQSERMSAKDCLQHPWIKSRGGKRPLSLQKNLQDSMSRWQKCAHAVMAVSRFKGVASNA